MSYRNILVHIDSSPRAKARLAFALQLAEAHDAHLTGLFVAPSAYISAIGPYPASGEVYYAINELIERDARAAQALFETHTAHYRAKTEWRQQIGLPVEAMCLHARYHDLVIIGQRDPDASADGLAPDFQPGVVMGCGRPVLVHPYIGDFPQIDRHALVAWNASRESTRAVTDALPLLRRAAKVTVLTINPEVSDRAHGEQPGADIAQYLARHDVKVEVARDSAFSRDVGEVLLSAIADRHADVMVMGLYGHSRLRELVMGGASRTTLAAMTVPVLMSH
jgi:nucleotide-binding universal stress UspA family protein